MTMIQETSIAAHNDLINDGKLQADELKVLNALSVHGPLTDCEISERTGLEKNAVNGRRNGLVKKGIVVERGTKVNPKSGKTNIAWGLYDRIF